MTYYDSETELNISLPIIAGIYNQRVNDQLDKGVIGLSILLQAMKDY